MATTTNYSWSTPDDTALVKDGAAAIRSLGTAIDTTVFTNAGAAINKSLIDAAGDLIYGTADNTAARLAIGTASQVLRVNSGATAPEWATPAASGGMTLISTTTLTGASVTLSSIPQTYKNLQLVIRNFKPATDGQQIQMRINGDSSANRYRSFETNPQVESAAFNAAAIDNVFANPQDNSTATGLSIVNIFDYTNAVTMKFTISTTLGNNSTTPANALWLNNAGIYNQIDAITSLVLLPGSGNFTSGSILLYGVS
jgi:hypothetical protein